jgi:hypothetical protein
MERNARVVWSVLALVWSGCIDGEDSPRGNAYEFVNLVSELNTGCIHYHSGSDIQRLSNKHPTRQVIVKRMTENNPTPEGPRVTIQDILLEPDATYQPIVGCTAFPDGRLVRRTVEEAWFVRL